MYVCARIDFLQLRQLLGHGLKICFFVRTCIFAHSLFGRWRVISCWLSLCNKNVICKATENISVTVAASVHPDIGL